jgi:hypothetical protein
MNSKISKLGAIVLTAFLIGTALFVPASSVKIEQSIVKDNGLEPYQEKFENFDIEAFYLDRSYIFDEPIGPLNQADNDDAGYKRDAGNDFARAFGIYPGEPIDDWPGRGRTGKLSSSDLEDWYFFSVCEGQEIVITMTPPTGFDFDIGLWDANKVEVANSTNSGSTPESINYVATQTNRWYLRIHYISGTGQGQYSFTVTMIGQNDAGTGDDAGDDFASATPISTKGVYYGYLDMDDEEDWYKFSVNSGQGIYFKLEMRALSQLSDFDIYLYNPSGVLKYYQSYYYDDELQYPADVSGDWRVRIKIFPGYADAPKPVDWEYYSYGSGPYRLTFDLLTSAPSPPGPIPQKDITPIAHTFKITNAPDSNVDDYGYLASIPACNYLEGGQRYLAPIVYSWDDTETNWFGTVDDTTDYLLEDWNTFLAGQGKTAVEYYVNSDPVKAAAEIATEAWTSSDLAVVAIDGSVYEDTTKEVLRKTTTLKRNADIITLPSDSPDIISFEGSYAYPMVLGNKWGAINVSIQGSDRLPSLMGIFPHYMTLASDWWPEHVTQKYDLYYPITSMGIWAASVGSITGTWDMVITKLECDRYKIDVGSDSVLTAQVTTPTPSDLLVFLVDPDGNVRAPDMPDWNGGPINPIHMWNGIDHTSYPPSCDAWRTWDPEPHTDFTAEIMHPEKGKWTVIVVPRYAEGESNIKYTLSVKVREINPKRADAAISAANAAVIASQEHVPLLYVRENSIPVETQNAFDALGVNKVIFVQRGSIGSGVESALPTRVANLKTMQEIVNYIKDYTHSENYITITSLKTGEGFFAPTAMLAAYHCSPVLRVGDSKGTASSGKTAIVGVIGENMYIFDPEINEFVWSSPTGWTPINQNQDAPQSSVYLGSTEDIIFSVNLQNLGVVWSNPVDCEDVPSAEGSLYLSQADDTLICIDNAGKEVWDTPLPTFSSKAPASMAEQIETWALWNGDYYHGNRAPGHLPIYNEPVEQLGNIQLLITLLKYLRTGEGEIPPLGLDAKRYWTEEMHNGIYAYINGLGLDLPGQEAYAFVAPRKDIRIHLHAAMTGNNSFAGHIIGDTPAYSSALIIRNIMYPALIFANPNRDVTTSQLMNFPDGGSWRTNDGVNRQVYSSRVLKNFFMSHGRTFDGHSLWDAHVERMNEGASVFYYSGHGTGGSGMSSQYLQNDYCNYPTQIWPDSWRGYGYDNWKTARDNGMVWYNPEPPNLYDFIHYKWIDQLFENLHSNAIFYMSCSTGQQFGPQVYLDHGAVIWYGNAGSGLCPQADLLDDWMFEEVLVNGMSVGAAFSKYMWLHQRDFTTGDPIAMYGSSSLYGSDGITTIPVIYGDPTIIIYSPEWTEPSAIDSVITESNNQQPLAPTVTGPKSGKPNTDYTFEFVTTDPNGDDIYYYVDWGDGDTEDWDGPYSSGELSSASHKWSKKGVYNIKVKARDVHGAEGPWGVLQISLPRPRIFSIFLDILERIIQRFPFIEKILTRLANIA